MIRELHIDRFDLLSEIFCTKETDHPEISSIILKNNPGQIFVDDINKPKTAIV